MKRPFDLILATNNLQELYNTRSFVDIVSERLNKNGIFVLSNVHNKNSEKNVSSTKLTGRNV